LQKRPVILRSLLIVATPYINAYTCISTSNTSISSVPCVNKEERYTYCVLKYASHANCMYLVCVQPIPLGVTFSNAVSKLKAPTSLLPRFSGKRRSSFELLALKELSKISPHAGLAVHVHLHVMWGGYN